MNKRIFRLAIPNIISNITIPLLGIVDTALMGHLKSLTYVGAIALGSMIFNFLYWGMGFLRMGTLGFTGQAHGASNSVEVSLVLQRSILIALSLAAIILLIHPWIIEGGLSLTHSSEAIKTEASNYFNVRIWALPASLVILSLSGWFVGMQNTYYPMLISILSNIANIILSFVFVFHFQMKTEGVALGTVLAQYIALIVGIILWLKKYKNYWFKAKWSELVNYKLTAFMHVNKDIFIRSLGIIFVLSYFTIKSANISDTSLAVNTLLFQFFIFFSYLMDGFANAGEALSSKAIGEKNIYKLKEVIKSTFILGLGFSLIFTLIYAFAGEYILKLFTNNQDLLAATTPLLFWVVALPTLSFPAFIFDGIFVGATASVAMRNTMIMATLLIFIPIMYSGFGDDIVRLWTAFLAFMFARGILLILYLKKSVLSKVQV